jgi:2-phosphosulfolactate phosphatase
VRIDVMLTAEAVVPSAVAGGAVVVVDVLRASTTIVSALAHGCRAVVPVADADEARRRASVMAGEKPLLAGERRGETIAGFDLGNSPVELASERVRGRTVIMTTSNGTRALLAVREASAVAVAGLVNVGAAAAWALDQSRAVTVVCAGERGAVSLEDHVCAGLLVERLAGAGPATLGPGAQEAAVVGRRYGKDVVRLREDSPWARHLVRTGRGGDVDRCLSLDATTLVPVYRADVDEIVVGRR